MKKEPFRGVGTALVTPFLDGKIDFPAFRRLCRYQLAGGADALIVCGTTGEAPTLSTVEKLRCIAVAAEEVSGKIPLIAGTGSNDTSRSAELSRLACREGADAVLAVAPYYNRPGAEGMTAHFLAIAEASGKPLIVYNVPSRTGCDIPDGVYEKLAESGAVVGIKEASGSVSRAAELLLRFGDRLAVYSGNDDLVLPLLSLGAAGVISVVSNLLPAELHSFCAAWFGGAREEATALYYRLLPLMKALFSETNPIPVKAALKRRGLCSGEMRLPLTEARAETEKALEKAMAPFFG